MIGLPLQDERVLADVGLPDIALQIVGERAQSAL
jgi:hypothetical protein